MSKKLALLLLILQGISYAQKVYYKKVDGRYFLKIGAELETYYYSEIEWEDLYKLGHESHLVLEMKEVKPIGCIGALKASLMQRRRLRWKK